jgi:hypothetical protein
VTAAAPRGGVPAEPRVRGLRPPRATLAFIVNVLARAGRQAVGLASLLLLIPIVLAAQPAELPLTVVTVGGHAELLRAPSAAWQPAVLRDTLRDNDGARVTAGRLTLKTVSGQSLRLAPATQLFVTGGGDATRVRLDGGGVWIATRPNSPPSTHVALQAGAVTITTAGGGTWVTSNADGSVLVATYHGAARCTGPGWERTVAADQQLLVPAAEPPKAPVKLKREKRDAEWVKWNELQDIAGGYGGRRPE